MHEESRCTTITTMTKAPQPTPTGTIGFEPEFIAGLKDLFEEKIVFNKLLGLKITSVAADRVTPASTCATSS
jgi:hypothetical protein